LTKSSVATQALIASCSTENRWREYRDILEPFARRLASKDETVGVVVLGGLADGGSRMFADEVSDLDLAVVVTLDLPPPLLDLPFERFGAAVQPYLPSWLPNFKFRVPGEATLDGVPIDIDTHQLILEYESQPHVRWNPAKLEAYANTAEIVYDPAGRIRELIDRKVADGRRQLDASLIVLAARGPILGEVDVSRLTRRGLLLHAHHILGILLDDVVAAIYAANECFPPDRKWRIAGLEDLPWHPRGVATRVSEAMLVHAHSPSDVERRRDLVLRLLMDVREHCERTFDWFPADAYTFAVTTLYSDRQLRRLTTADSVVAPLVEQYAKMGDHRWNRANWMLET
jgi:hypothetical protein